MIFFMGMATSSTEANSLSSMSRAQWERFPRWSSTRRGLLAPTSAVTVYSTAFCGRQETSPPSTFPTPPSRGLPAFVLRDGEFISIDIPGATSSEGNGIDPQGDVVGRYVTPDGNTHGYFLRCVTCSRHDPTGLPGSTQ